MNTERIKIKKQKGYRINFKRILEFEFFKSKESRELWNGFT